MFKKDVSPKPVTKNMFPKPPGYGCDHHLSPEQTIRVYERLMRKYEKNEEEVKMDNQDFIDKCKDLVVGYANERLDKTDGEKISEDDVFVVWSCKTLQNSKALLSTTLSDGMYYELTLNGDKGEIYLDAYKKWENIKYDV
ncbi:hypothetical protein PGRAN_02595 [Listeria grandensis FSL F6-0971]|uniref:Uncharacterized protein n=2 Tax=Listeria grandensis TaxID=1494963 RepID=W7BWQ6_9LIST|nr:hypothetical protein PGRAN_02595 [Listeria grandensis FSL F6-0971]